MSVKVIHADVLAGLGQLTDGSVHCVVTSPPYWNLRDYGYEGQIGLEPTMESHILRMVQVFRDVRRVLRDDGTLWLNYGDMYAGSWGAQSRGHETQGTLQGSSMLDARRIQGHPSRTQTGSIKRFGGLKPKDLVMMPHRIAIALQADGWWVRDDIVWHKPNPMPSSVTDRCTPAKEYVFLLTKSARYYFDAAAIAEPRTSDEDANGFRGGSYVGGEPGPRTTTGNKRIKVPGGWDTGTGGHGSRHRSGRTVGEYVERKNEQSVGAMTDASARTRVGFNDRWDGQPEPMTRNKRNVWTIATEPYPEGHFATMPTELARLCIMAGCPKGGTVLDPFGGAGTTGLVADRLQRNAILIEASAEYVERHIKPRIAEDQGPLLAQIEAAQ